MWETHWSRGQFRWVDGGTTVVPNLLTSLGTTLESPFPGLPSHGTGPSKTFHSDEAGSSIPPAGPLFHVEHTLESQCTTH